ncbi:histidine phosphatase family protein [soil metagenome]
MKLPSRPAPATPKAQCGACRYSRRMTTVLLVRHGLTALTGPILAGWTPGVHLDERGQAQAAGLAERLRDLPLAALVTSPLERCVETATALRGQRDQELHVDERLGEAGYGDWSGQPLKKLAKDPLWKVVQAHPSAVRFPNGETLRATQARAVDAVRDWNARLGPDATYLACTHADVIKAVVADALGLHLDLFQRITVDPCSLTVIRYTELRPLLVRLNDTGGGVTDLVPARRRARHPSLRRGRTEGNGTTG